MKVNLSRMLRSGIALLLVFCLAVGFVPTVAFATEAPKKYVSLGDSMTNGYGLTGYDAYGSNGFLEEASESYPVKVAAYYGWELTQLATSAMRVEDLNYILGGSFAGDQWTQDELLTNTDRWGSAWAEQNDVKATFVNAVTEADVITMAAGNGNFGVFLLGRITNALGLFGSAEADAWIKFEDALATLDAESKAAVMSMYNKVLDYAKGKLPANLAEPMTKAVGYTLVSFVLNYSDTLDRIVELNPDAEIILVGLMNTMSGYELNVEYQGKTYTIDMEQILNLLLQPLNAYLAVMPAVKHEKGQYAEAKIYYTDVDTIAVMSESYRDVYMEVGSYVDIDIDGDGNCDTLAGNNTVRDRFVEGIANFIGDLMSNDGLKALTLADVLAYEYDPYAYVQNSSTTGKAQTVAMYLGLEEAVLKALEAEDLTFSLDTIMGSGADNAEAFLGNVLGNIMANIESNVSENAAGKIDEAMKAVATGMGVNPTIVQQQYLTDRATQDGVKKYAALLATPETIVEAMTSDDLVLALLNLYGRLRMGDGLSAHPSVAGHDQLTNAIIKTYDEKHTVQDDIKETVEIALNELYKLVETYGPEVAAQVWAQWEEYGYVEMVETSMSELKDMLEKRYTYYTETALPSIAASVENLSAQKDALTAELTGLKAELEAKQAELEAVVNNVQIGDIYVPDINIDVELGNNPQTQIPENDCTVDGEDIKAELEAAVKDLEHAIAVIEALIADIEADIADMVALAEQIAAAVAELEKTMSDVAAAAEELEKAINDVIDVIKNSDGVVEQVVKSFNAARATAEAAVEVLTLTMGTAEEMMADVDTMIQKIATDAEALYNKFMNDLPGCIEQIPEEAKMLIGGTVLAVQQAYEANKDEIDAALTAELKKLAEEYGISEESVKAELTKLAQEYEANKAAVKAELTEIEVKITAEAKEKYAEIEAEYNAQIEAAKAEAAAKLAALEAELKGYQAELEALAEDAAEEVKAGIQAQIDRVNADIATVNADLAHAVTHLENAAQEAYEQIVAEVTKVYEETITALEQKLSELKEAHDKAVAALNEKLAELKAAYDKAVEDLTAEADKAITELTEALNKTLEELGKIGEALADEVNGILTAIRDELADAQKAVEEILKGNLAAIEELKDALIEMGGEAIAEAIDNLIDAVMNLIEKATTADLVIDDDFKYVAIGDGSAAPESYVEKLTAALNAEAVENGVDEIEVINFAKAGNTVAAEREDLSDVSGADLITVGFSNVEFLSKAIANAGSGAKMDWAAIVGAENVQYVEQLLAEVAAKIAEAGIEGESAVMANAAIEAYAYAAVQYATELPELVNDIHAANPEALVIIVGMYNSMEGVTIALDANTTLDIGEYVDYLVKGVGVHGVAYSILTGNSIYVDAPAVQTVNTDTELGFMDMLNLIQTGYASLYPSAVGDDYIAAEIADALNITYVKREVEVLLGDVNDDGVVDSKDVVRLRKYFADPETTEINFANSDVNLDGVVDSKDMVRMRKHFADGVAFG